MLDPSFIFEREALTKLRYVLPILGMALVFIYALMGKHKLPALRGVVASVLVASVGLGFVFYTASHWRNGTFLNGYEFFHYYLGAKYAPELGYTGLYAASWEAQRENGDTRLPPTIRDLKTEGMMRPSADSEGVREARAAFTPSRWEAFKADVAFIKFSDWKLWNRMHQDKGFNATPPWTLVAMPIASSVTTKGDETIRWLPWLDVAFILLAMACVTYAFGPRAMLLLLLFLGGHYLLSHFTLKSAFLRVDWVMCLVMAVCLLKKDHFVLAGLLTGYAALMRVFPAFFAFGVAGAWGWELLRKGPNRRNYFNFFAAMAAISIVMVAASVLVLGVDYWREFLAKISGHNDDLTPWRVGFKYAFLQAPQGRSPGGMAPMAYLEANKTLYYGLIAAALAVTVVAARNLPAHRALALGFVPVFFLVAPTYYYMVMLAVPFLYFAEDGARWSRAAGMLLMFATSLVGHDLFLKHDRGWMTFHWISVLVLGMCVYMLLTGLLTRRPNSNPVEEKGSVKKSRATPVPQS